PGAQHRGEAEAPAPRPPVEESLEPDILRKAIQITIADRHEPAGIGVWQGTEQHGVDDREDGGVRADPEHQRHERRGGESRRAAQHPQAIADVLSHRIGESESALVSPGLGNLRIAAEIEPGGAAGVGCAEAARAVALLEHLAMKRELLRELTVA